MGYLRPVSAPISASWQAHRNRNPPSSEPGTDYASAWGTPCLCAESGTVVALSNSTSGGTGRFITVNLDDGRRVRYLHLAAIFVQVGFRVGRGAVLGNTGASGFGSEWGYGAHVHVSLWERPGLPIAQTIDFENHVGEPTNETETDMDAEQDARLRNVENLLQVQGQGFGWPQVAGQAAQDLQARFAVPGAGFDWLPAINNKVDSMWKPLVVAAVASVLALVGVYLYVTGKPLPEFPRR